MPGRTAADRERCAVGLGRGCGASPGQPGECGRAPPAAFPQGSDGESCRSPSLPPSLPLSLLLSLPSLSFPVPPSCLPLPPSPSSGPKLSQPQLFTSCSAGCRRSKANHCGMRATGARTPGVFTSRTRPLRVHPPPQSLLSVCCVPGTVLDAGGSQQ